MYTVDSQRHGFWHRIHHHSFDALYRRSLLYNTCWEDPRLDLEAMDLQPDSEVLVITSAGCNALDYALAGPARIDAVDANPRQTALLELKQAGIRALDWDDFFRLFGHGRHPAARELYRQSLRKQLSPESRIFWDRRITWFQAVAARRAFYYQGLSGSVARLVTAMLRQNPRLWRGICALMEARSLVEQRQIYDQQIGQRLIGRSLGWILDRQVTMSMLGVPYPQREAVRAEHERGVAGFIAACLDQVCCQLPFWDNYFWTVYLRGHYTPGCCPRYLSETGFAALKAGLVDRVVPHTDTVTGLLRSSAAPQPSHLVLLDHMDWMADAFPRELAEEWQAIFTVARPDARVLFRSGAREPGFLDGLQVERGGQRAPLREHLRLDSALASALHRRDRVHTYASFHIADL